MNIIDDFVFVLHMLPYLCIIMQSMLQELIFQGQLVPHTVNNILYVLLVTADSICYSDMLVICHKFCHQTYNTVSISTLILDNRLMNRTTHLLLCRKSNTLEDVNFVFLIHSQEYTLTLSCCVIEEQLHQGEPVFLCNLVFGS